MATHTPGSWRVGAIVQNDGSIAIMPEEGERIGTVDAYETPIGEANAKLVAASPLLLAALEGLLAEHAYMNRKLRVIGRGHPDDGAHPDAPATIARDAIKAATS